MLIGQWVQQGLRSYLSKITADGLVYQTGGGLRRHELLADDVCRASPILVLVNRSRYATCNQADKEWRERKVNFPLVESRTSGDK